MRYWFLLLRAKSVTALFQLNPDRCQLEISLPVMLALLWISFQFINSITREWNQWQTTSIKPNVISLETVIASCMITFFFGVVIVCTLAVSHHHSLQKLGFRANDKRGQLRDGSIGFLLLLIPVMSLLLVTHSFRTEETMHPFLLLLKEHPEFSTIAWISISAVVVAPLFEELIYRVILQSWLENFLHPIVAISISSVIFSFVHGFPDCIPLFPLAFILGTLFYYRRSYASIVMTHALFNGINLAFALANQQSPG
ncbi:CPBP family intramembrane glutamic endopeptidase [Gimesia aquarii]|nr:CPBP family intramembrane glutamic endopeptidase [Gimesia aquarii]